MRGKFTKRAICASCGQTIEWLGRSGGWRDMAGHRQCDPTIGEAKRPPAGTLHKPEPKES